MKNSIKFRALSGRKAVLWGLVVALALLLILGAGVPFGYAQDGQESTLAASHTQTHTPAQARTVTYAYDSAGRLTTANYGGGIIIAYTYDPGGNLVGVSLGGYNVYLPLVLRQSP